MKGNSLSLLVRRSRTVPAEPEYLVSGAGKSAANGVYQWNGQYSSGAKIYKNTLNAWTMRFYGSSWVICEDMTAYYYETSSAEVPVGVQWQIGGGGDAPAPSVTLNE